MKCRTHAPYKCPDMLSVQVTIENIGALIASKLGPTVQLPECVVRACFDEALRQIFDGSPRKEPSKAKPN